MMKKHTWPFHQPSAAQPAASTFFSAGTESGAHGAGAWVLRLQWLGQIRHWIFMFVKGELLGFVIGVSCNWCRDDVRW